MLIAAKALFFTAATIAMWFWVILQVQPLSRRWDRALPAWIAAVGAIALIIGTVGVIVCVLMFVARGRGTPALFDAPRQFVAIGPYRYVRNPMYLSALAVFAGFGLYARSLAVLAFAGAWFLFIHAFVLLVEEPGLRRRFGQTYSEYCRRVPRWLPRLAL
jgi:protein-S-isoprenylcysteine O-methyltransferase Ste14